MSKLSYTILFAAFVLGACGDNEKHNDFSSSLDFVDIPEDEAVLPVGDFLGSGLCLYKQNYENLDVDLNGFRLSGKSQFCEWIDDGQTLKHVSYRHQSNDAFCENIEGSTKLQATNKNAAQTIISMCNRATWLTDDIKPRKYEHFRKVCFNKVGGMIPLSLGRMANLEKQFSIPVKYYGSEGSNFFIYIEHEIFEKDFIRAQIDYAIKTLVMEEIEC
jgi:hypothetical protein